MTTLGTETPMSFEGMTNQQAGQILSALTRPVEPRRVHTAGLPLGTTLDIKIKNKIWSG